MKVGIRSEGLKVKKKKHKTSPKYKSVFVISSHTNFHQNLSTNENSRMILAYDLWGHTSFNEKFASYKVIVDILDKYLKD